MKRVRYSFQVERTESGYGAWVPDLPGCGTTGETLEETIGNLEEALCLYLESAANHGDAVPVCACEGPLFIEVPAPAKLRFVGPAPVAS